MISCTSRLFSSLNCVQFPPALLPSTGHRDVGEELLSGCMQRIEFIEKGAKGVQRVGEGTGESPGRPVHSPSARGELSSIQ